LQGRQQAAEGRCARSGAGNYDWMIQHDFCYVNATSQS